MKPLTTFRIAQSNLSGKPGRAAALIIVVAIMAFALFGGAILSQSLNNGMESLKARLGADIAIVPYGSEADYEDIILSGTPVSFYFDRGLVNHVAAISGVYQATAQFYLASLALTDCCTTETQIVGINYATDFVVTPWISELLHRQIGDGEVIVGSDVLIDTNSTVTFFGTTLDVAARLSRTATGMDNTVFVNMETAVQIGHIAQAGGFIPNHIDIENAASVILVNVDPDFDVSIVMNRIRANIPDVGLIESHGIYYALTSALSFITGLIVVVMVVLGFLALLVLAVLFSLIASSRKKEFAVLRIVGATRGKLAAVVLMEAVILSAVGSAIGCLVAAIVVFPFGRIIGIQMGMPLLLPGIFASLLILILAIVISAVVGPLASAYSAYKISRAETYAVMRDGE